MDLPRLWRRDPIDLLDSAIVDAPDEEPGPRILNHVLLLKLAENRLFSTLHHNLTHEFCGGGIIFNVSFGTATFWA